MWVILTVGLSAVLLFPRGLREAIIAANNTAGPQAITFSPALSGGTISINFDNLDVETDADPLPFLCDGGTTINGDLDGDNVPDITLDVSAVHVAADGIDDGIVIAASDTTVNGLRLLNVPDGGIGVVHLTTFPATEIENTTISNNDIRGGVASVFVQAGLSSPLGAIPGVVRNTTVTGNVLSGADVCGICITTSDAPDAEIDGTTVVGNQVLDGHQSGILVQTNFPGGRLTSITDTMIRGNEVSGNAGTGIAAGAYAGQSNEISGLEIRENTVHDNLGGGIGMDAGVCGATDNLVAATVTGNALTHNGSPDLTSGIGIAGAGNFITCMGAPAPAARNRLLVAISGNTLTDELGNGIGIFGGAIDGNENTVSATVTGNVITGAGDLGIVVAGGLGSATTRADGNTVTATISRNRVIQAGDLGVRVAGGIAAADHNRVTVMVTENTIAGSAGTGLEVTGGIQTGGASVAGNSVDVTVSGGVSCGNRTADVSCRADFLAEEGAQLAPTFTTASGNEVTLRMTASTATATSFDESCSVQADGTRPCACAGDCDGDGGVSINELVGAVRIALGTDALESCAAVDADFDRSVTVGELMTAVGHALTSCSLQEKICART